MYFVDFKPMYVIKHKLVSKKNTKEKKKKEKKTLT